MRHVVEVAVPRHDPKLSQSAFHVFPAPTSSSKKIITRFYLSDQIKYEVQLISNFENKNDYFSLPNDFIILKL
jgi:hypothetical protein